MTKDFVALHSKGFQTSDNVDLFNHVLRLLLKNHHLLKTELVNNKSKQSTYKQNTDSKNQQDGGSDEESVDYMPIEIKHFVLDVSKKELEVLENIVSMYERQTGNRLNTNANDTTFKNDETYTAAKLEDEMAKENNFLEQVLKKINDSGVDSISLSQMVKFKHIMRKRLEVFSRLQTHIEISGLLQTKPTTAQEAQFKEELQHTFRQVQKIAELHPLLSFRHQSMIPNSLGLDSRNLASTSREGIRSSRTPFDAKAEFSTNNTDNIITSIKKSIDTARTLDRTVKELRKGRKSTTPVTVQRIGSLEDISEKAVKFQEPWEHRRPKIRSLTSLTPIPDSERKDWNNIPTDPDNPEKKGEAIEKQNTIAAIVNEVKRKRRPSLTLPKRKNQKNLTHQVSRDDINTDLPMTANERKVRLERLLAKDPPPMAPSPEEEEEAREAQEEKDRRKIALKEIERAWKEKDFEFLRSYLRGPTIKTSSLKDGGAEKQDQKNSSEGMRRRKKKKKNPNISTNSGGLTTLAKDKYRRSESSTGKNGDKDVQNTARDGAADNSLIEEEDEDEDDVFSHILSKDGKTSPLKKKKKFHIDINQALNAGGNGKTKKIQNKHAMQDGSNDIQEITNSKRPKLLKKTGTDVGFSMIKGETMGMSTWQKGEAHVEMPKSELGSPESRYGLGNLGLDSVKEKRDKKNFVDGVGKLKFSEASKVLERLTGVKKDSLTESSQSKAIAGDQKSSKDDSIVSGFGRMNSSDVKEISLMKNDIKKNLLNKKADDTESRNFSLDETNKTVTEPDDKKKNLNVSGVGKKSDSPYLPPIDSSKLAAEKAKTLDRNNTNITKIQPTIKEETIPENNTKTPKAKKEVSASFVSKGEIDNSRTLPQDESATKEDAKSKIKTIPKDKLQPLEQEKEKDKPKEKNLKPALEIIKWNSQEGSTTQNTNQAVQREELVKVVHSPQKERPTPEMPSPKVKSLRSRDLTAPKSKGSQPIPTEESESSATESLNTVEEIPSALSKFKRNRPSKRAESPQQEGEILFNRRRTTRTIIRPDFEGKNVDDLLDDPMKLLSTVLKIHDIDHDTKLDLYMYGNRKQALKDFIKEIEDTIEHNVLKQEECINQLDTFYDTKLNTLLLTRTSDLYPQQKAARFDAHMTWKRSSTGIISPDFDGDQGEFLAPQFSTPKAKLEYLHEQARRQAFASNRALVNTIKAYDQKKCKVFTHGYMGVTNDIRNGKGLLSPTVIETLLQNKNATLLEVQNQQEEEGEEEFDKEYEEKQEKEAQELMGRIERIRRFLRELKRRDPPHFRELIETLEENKNFYNIMMNDINDGKNRPFLHIPHLK